MGSQLSDQINQITVDDELQSYREKHDFGENSVMVHTIKDRYRNIQLDNEDSNGFDPVVNLGLQVCEMIYVRTNNNEKFILDCICVLVDTEHSCGLSTRCCCIGDIVRRIGKN